MIYLNFLDFRKNFITSNKIKYKFLNVLYWEKTHLSFGTATGGLNIAFRCIKKF